MSQDGRHVFLSHSAADVAKVRQLNAFLKARGVRTWIALDDIRSGKSYPAQTHEAIERCAALVVALTAAANESPFVCAETELAFGLRKPIYPVRLEDVKPSRNLGLFVRMHQWTDAFGPGEVNLAALAAELAALAPAAPVQPPPPPPPPPPTPPPSPPPPSPGRGSSNDSDDDLQFPEHSASSRRGTILALSALFVTVLGLVVVANWREPFEQPAVPAHVRDSAVPIGPPVLRRLTANDGYVNSSGRGHQYILNGRRGQRLQLRATSRGGCIRLSIGSYELSIEAPFRDVPTIAQSCENPAFNVILPSTDRYYVYVGTGEDRDITYELQVTELPAMAVLPRANRLAGRWHRSAGSGCESPITNGFGANGAAPGELLYARGQDSGLTNAFAIYRIIDVDGLRIEAQLLNMSRGQRRNFVLSEDGQSYAVNGETWKRCAPLHPL